MGLNTGFSSLVICLHFKGVLSKHNASTPRVETQALQPPQRVTFGKSEVFIPAPKLTSLGLHSVI